MNPTPRYSTTARVERQPMTSTPRVRLCRERKQGAVVVTRPLGLSVSVTEAMIEEKLLDAALIDDKEMVSEAAEAALEEWAAGSSV